MGIKDMSKYYEHSKFELTANTNFYFTFIDFNYYWMKWYNCLSVLEPEESFLTLLESRLLIRKKINFGLIYLVCDNPVARKLLKWATVMNRFNKMVSGVLPVNYNKLQLLCNERSIYFVVSEFDTDRKIFNLIKGLDVKQEQNIVKIDGQIQNASSICVFSGDSDFISFYPDYSIVCILNNNYSLYCGNNLKLNNIHSFFSIYFKLIGKDVPDTVIKKKYLCTFMKLYFTTQPSDYLTCSFYDAKIFMKCFLAQDACNNINFFCAYYKNWLIKHNITKALLNNILRLASWNPQFAIFKFDRSCNPSISMKELEFMLLEKIDFFTNQTQALCEYEERFKHYLVKAKTFQVEKLIQEFLLLRKQSNCKNLNFSFASLAFFTFITLPNTWLNISINENEFTKELEDIVFYTFFKEYTNDCREKYNRFCKSVYFYNEKPF